MDMKEVPFIGCSSLIALSPCRSGLYKSTNQQSQKMATKWRNICLAEFLAFDFGCFTSKKYGKWEFKDRIRSSKA